MQLEEPAGSWKDETFGGGGGVGGEMGVGWREVGVG